MGLADFSLKPAGYALNLAFGLQERIRRDFAGNLSDASSKFVIDPFYLILGTEFHELSPFLSEAVGIHRSFRNSLLMNSSLTSGGVSSGTSRRGTCSASQLRGGASQCLESLPGLYFHAAFQAVEQFFWISHV